MTKVVLHSGGCLSPFYLFWPPSEFFYSIKGLSSSKFEVAHKKNISNLQHIGLDLSFF